MTVKADKIIKLYQDGTPLQTIANITGNSRNTVKKHLKAAGIYTPPIYNINNNIYKDLNTKDINISNPSIGSENIPEGNNINNIDRDKNSIILSGDMENSNTNSQIVAPDTSDLHQLKTIDRILNKTLKRLNNITDIKDTTPMQAANIIAILQNTKSKIKEGTQQTQTKNQFIINFIQSRNFKEEIQTVKDLKQLAITATATEIDTHPETLTAETG